MKILSTEHWAGIFSLAWFLAGAVCFHLHAILYHGYGFSPEWFFYFAVLVVWWLVSLLLALWALIRGTEGSSRCAAITLALICGYFLFVFVFLPVVFTS